VRKEGTATLTREGIRAVAEMLNATVESGGSYSQVLQQMTQTLFVGRHVIPFAELTPAACEIVAETVEQAMVVFAAWNIPLPKQTGLRQAVAVLRRIAAQGSWGTTRAELAAITPALTLAGDFILVAQSLSREPVATISDEIGTALGESLGAIAKVGGYELHSQYWFGMVLARAGLRPRVPRPGERRPDFVVATDGIDFGLEHKRPKSAQSAEGAMDKAAAQLRDYDRKHNTPGLIVLDLSNAVGTQHLAGVRLPVVRGHVHTHIGESLQEQAARLDQRTQTFNLSNKYDRMVGLVCYSRALLWIEKPIGLVPTITAWVVTYVSARGCAGIIQDSVHRLFGALKRTIQEFGDAPVHPLRAS